jgi:4-hydroxythreonine-4-phosphate dehydrogenase
VNAKKKIAISVGDLNGVGIEIALKAHEQIKAFSTPIYCINSAMLQQAASMLGKNIPNDFEILHVNGKFTIAPGAVSSSSGLYSYLSFLKAIQAAEKGDVDAIVTMPINKEAWMKAGIAYKGHTEMLRDYFKKDAIMMLGCEKMYVALFTEHIPLKKVPSLVTVAALEQFFRDFIATTQTEKIAVLGLNPHAGDNGVLGDEEKFITQAIESINREYPHNILYGPIVPDVAFTPHFRQNFTYFIAMYHDQGLAPLKALYFDESVNISLNLPIVRTSVDHGTAFDIAYTNSAQTQSYINALKSACALRPIT